MIRGVLVGALLLLSATAARSEISAKGAVEHVQAGDERIINFLKGVGVGLM
jgi:hypothetical protein